MKQETTQQSQAAWLRSRIDRWHKFDSRLNADRSRPGDGIEDCRALLNGYRALISDLSLARNILPDGRISRYLESLFVRGHEIVYATPGRLLIRWLGLYQTQVPALMKATSTSLIITIALFFCSVAVGWGLVTAFPELISLFASTEMIDKVQGGELWTDSLLNIFPSSVLSLQIIANNITVTLFAFVLGALYGVGTLYIIGLNGLMLGGVFAFTRQYQLDARLFEFIVAHGVVELSIICISAAMGLKLGESLIRPGLRSRVLAFQQTVSATGKVMLAATPFLILAGLIEGHISPDPGFGLGFRIVVGLTTGVAFWWLMLFGVRLKPPHPRAEQNKY